MQSIDQLQKLVNKAIADKKYPDVPAELYDPINYLMLLGGKRMRPVMLLMACDLFNGSILKSLDPAIGIELFHNFTLVHDDIMDKAPLRRGNPTVHAKWNQNIAILAGDTMLVEAYRQVMQVDDIILRDVLDIFNNTAESVCQGQQIDMNFEQVEEVTVDKYIDMIRLKTAVLLAASLKIGGLIGGAEPEQAESLYRFGENLGIAFQLQDDILDVYGEPEKFGKQIGGDIISNKKTFLLIKALEIAEGLESEELRYWMASGQGNTEKVKAITGIYNRLGMRQLAETEMNHYAEKALRYLEEVNADNLKKQSLRKFAEELLVREN